MMKIDDLVRCIRAGQSVTKPSCLDRAAACAGGLLRIAVDGKEMDGTGFEVIVTLVAGEGEVIQVGVEPMFGIIMISQRRE
jgi:hypothetical protein